MSGPAANGPLANGDADLERLIAEFEASGLRELHVRHDGLELYLSRDGDAGGIGAAAPQPVPHSAPAAPSLPVSSGATPVVAALPPSALPDGAVLVRAPYLGTFYRSPKPGEPSYVELGQIVGVEDEVCLVEVMKLFTAVRAGVVGTVHAVLASDGEMVQADQPLFAILPA